MTTTLIIWLNFMLYLLITIKHYFRKEYRANMHPVLHLASWIALAALGVFELYIISTYALPHR